MRILSILFVAVIWASFASAGEYVFDDQNQQQQFQQLTQQLRCVTCPNQSIHDSDAPVAQAMMKECYERLKKGESQELIKTYFVERYGEYVLYQPRRPLLWLGPLLLIGLIVGYWIKSHE